MRPAAMSTRALCAVMLTCALLTVFAGSAAGAGHKQAKLPSCEALLTRSQAAAAMDQEDASPALNKILGGARYCSWFAFSKPTAYSVAVKWGPYSEFRNRSGKDGKTVMCAVDVRACQTLKLALKEKPNAASFDRFAKALDEVGTVRRLPAFPFGGNAAVAWKPTAEWMAASRLGETTWAFVYDRDSESMLSSTCGASGDTPTITCAIETARRAYNNVT